MGIEEKDIDEPVEQLSPKECNREFLLRDLNRIGFNEFLYDELERKINNCSQAFNIRLPKEFDSEKVIFELNFEDAGNGWFLFKDYNATFYYNTPIEHALINGVNTQDLESKMQKADWYYEYAESSYEWEKGFAEVEVIESHLHSISEDDKGIIIATKLWNNNVPFFSVGKPSFISKCEQENNLYQTFKFPNDKNIIDALNETKRYLKLIPTIAQEQPAVQTFFSNKDHETEIKIQNISSLKIGIMTENEKGFNENQFKRFGLKEAFTPEVIKKMEKGEPHIQEQFHKMYNGDEASAVIYLKKSATSSLYFLNKFDLSVRKEGQAHAVKQTFYNNDFQKKVKQPEELYGVVHEVHQLKKIAEQLSDQPGERTLSEKNTNKFYTTFTFKEAVNYCLGHPVLKTFKNQNQEEYQAWVKPNFKNVLSNGNYEMQQYRVSKDGFDHEKVLSNFSIKETANPQYKQRLIESHQRGNLQLTTFVGVDGKEEKLYTSPNIPLKTLNVYDLDKQRVPTQTLVDKGYIGKEIAEELKQRIDHLKEKNWQEHSQKNDHKQTVTKEDKQTVNKEQKNKKSVNKEQKQNNKETQKTRPRKQTHKVN